LTHLTITESSRLIPYLTGNRKASKEYLRVLLEFWASPSASDEIRLSAFLGIRRLALAGDRGLAELVLKGAYLSISQAAKATTVFTLPGLNLMKNSAATLFTASALGGETQAYQIAFSYIRQLAVTLRNTMKSTSRSAGGSGGGGGAGGAGAGGEKAKGKVQQGKEPYRQVYNWQFCHSLDFWSLVLASACDSTREAEQGKESELRALIYPLVQITLGVIR
jgi:nucleolar complex protein 2